MDRNALAAMTAVAALAAGGAAAAAPACRAESAPRPPLVVELYTSEGCSSCPPADRWLSSLTGRADVLPLAFHVDYWDRLGWADRYATRAGTARQWALARLRGSPQVYTPQVVADGRDWTAWPKLPPAPGASALHVVLVREGDAVGATVDPAPGGLARLSAYWAVTEDGHASKVTAGENAGARLAHDRVVRLYRPLPAWAASAGVTASLTVTPGAPQHPRRVAFVVVDAATGRPLQAAVLGC